jgi:hypothetical protein
MRQALRRAFWPVAGSALVVLLFLAAAGGAARLHPGPPWWEVRIDLAVRGEYTIKDFGVTFAGQFSGRTRWHGSMEPDGPDFLLYYTTADVPEWEIVEKTALPNATRIVTQKADTQKPRLRVNYIIRQGDDLRFDFEVDGVLVPLSDSPEKFKLVLPRSKECFGEGTGYGESISKGNNLVAMGAEGLESGHAEKSFSWEWKRQHWTVREKGAAFVADFHKVTVTVTLIRH